MAPDTWIRRSKNAPHKTTASDYGYYLYLPVHIAGGSERERKYVREGRPVALNPVRPQVVLLGYSVMAARVAQILKKFTWCLS